MHVSRRLLNTLSRQSDFAIIWPAQPSLIPGAPIYNRKHGKPCLEAAPMIDGDPICDDESTLLLSEYLLAPSRKQKGHNRELEYLASFGQLKNIITRSSIKIEHVEEPGTQWSQFRLGCIRVLDRCIGVETIRPQNVTTFSLRGERAPDTHIYLPEHLTENEDIEEAIKLEEMLQRQTVLVSDEPREYHLHHLMKVYLYPDIEHASRALAGKQDARYWNVAQRQV